VTVPVRSGTRTARSNLAPAGVQSRLGNPRLPIDDSSANSGDDEFQHCGIIILHSKIEAALSDLKGTKSFQSD
jgi:hypothetical protein